MERPQRSYHRPGRSTDDVRAEVDEELDHHMELVEQELIAEGWPKGDARAEAERRFGDMETTRDVCTRESDRTRKEEGLKMGFETLRQDLVYAFRTLRRAPTYATVVILTLAAGIALNTLVFSVMNPYLFRPLPYQDADRLVHLGGIDRLEGWDVGRFSAPQLADLRERARTLEGIAGYYYGTVNLTGEASAERVTGSWVTGDLFGLLGVDGAFGRVLGPDDDHVGSDDVVVLGHGLFTRRFGGDPAVVGRTIRLDGTPTTVVGVAPPDFNFPFNAVQLWLPMRADPVAASRTSMGMLLVARLADGATADRTEAELAGISRELGALHPDADGRYDGIAVHSLRETLNFAWEILRPAFLILLVGVGLVLVIACVNVASLTLARAGARQRDVAVRAAVGAGRDRIVRQLLVESGLLALGGGVLGVALAYLGTRLVRGLIPSELYRVGEVSVDGRVMAFSALVTLATPLVFGLAPALAAVRADLISTLRDGGSGAGSGRRQVRGRRSLVVAEVALAVVLVTGTGLMVRSLANALEADLGFAPERILTVAVTPSESDYPDEAALEDGYRGLVEALSAVPGVATVGSVSHLPLNHETIPVRYTTPDRLDLPIERRPSAYTSRAGPTYFETMGIPLLAGRAFRPGAVDQDEASLIVTRTLADALWPDGTGIGRTLVYGSGENPLTGTVVGIVGDVAYDGLTGAPRPHLYRPLEGTATRRRFLVISTGEGGTPDALVEGVRQALARTDGDLPAEIRPMMAIVRESTGLWAISSVFLGVFGLVALALAALGVYGLIAYSVSQRRREMGLRLALGADPRAVGRSVLGEGLKLTGIGLAIGFLLSTAAAVLASSLLFGVPTIDPVAFGGTALVFMLVAVAASVVPARRATRVDPVQVLRAE